MITRSLSLEIPDRAQQGARLNPFLRDYYARVTLDTGTIKSRAFTQSVNALYDSFGQTPDKFKLTIAPEMAYKPNVISPTQTNVAKLYSLNSGNDAVQATQLSQPSLGGTIAPNDKLSLVNGNGQAKFMTHTPISFVASDAWSVTTVLDWNAQNANSNTTICSGVDSDTKNRIGMDHIYNSFLFTPNSTAQTVRSVPINSFNKILGKNVIFTIVGNNGTVSLYLNGVILISFAYASDIILSAIMQSVALGNLTGSVSFHSIKAFALTASQALAEATLLQSYFPTKVTVKIGEQDWCVNNEQVVCTPMGTVIPEVQDNTAWANSQVLYDNAYAATSGTVEQKKTAALKAASMWRSPNNDASLAVIYGKHYNKYAIALLAEDIAAFNTANPAALWGYDVPTRAQLTTLSAIGGNAAKKDGAVLWTTANGSNSSGLSLVGGAYTAANGVYTDARLSTGLMCKDANFVRVVKDGDNTFSEVAITTEGYPFRMIKI